MNDAPILRVMIVFATIASGLIFLPSRAFLPSSAIPDCYRAVYYRPQYGITNEEVEALRQVLRFQAAPNGFLSSSCITAEEVAYLDSFQARTGLAVWRHLAATP